MMWFSEFAYVHGPVNSLPLYFIIGYNNPTNPLTHLMNKQKE